MSTKDAYAAPVITQLYANSGQTKDIFGQVGVANSAVMSMKELREHVTKYVDQNQLRWRNMVKLDPHLHKCVFGKGKEEIEEVTWDKVFGGVQAKTNPAYSIQFPGQHPHIRKVFFLSFFKYSYSYKQMGSRNKYSLKIIGQRIF